MQQAPVVRLAQCVRAQQGARDAAELVDHVDAQAAGESIQLSVRQRVEAQPRRLQRVRHEQAVGCLSDPMVAIARSPRIVDRALGNAGLIAYATSSRRETNPINNIVHNI